MRPPGPLRAAPGRDRGARVPRQRPARARRRLPAGGQDAEERTGNALLLAGQAERLVSGDVVWDDLFKDPAIEELRQQGITGVAVPASSFVPNPDFASTRFWEAILQRLSGSSTSGGSGGLHGTGLVSTKALPGNQELSTSTENTVTATTDLGFAVTSRTRATRRRCRSR